MNSSITYIAFAVVVLAVIAILTFFLNKKEKRLSKLAGFSFVFVIAEIIFRDNRFIGYSLIGIGVIIAVIDMIKKIKTNSKIITFYTRGTIHAKPAEF